MKSRHWFFLFLLTAVLCTALWFLIPRRGSSVVLICQDGKTVRTIDLDAVSHPFTIRVSFHGHSNEILVEPGQIRVSRADCPDQICVLHGPLCAGETPIVCLPNRLVIRWDRDASSPDALSR